MSRDKMLKLCNAGDPIPLRSRAATTGAIMITAAAIGYRKAGAELSFAQVAAIEIVRTLYGSEKRDPQVDYDVVHLIVSGLLAAEHRRMILPVDN